MQNSEYLYENIIFFHKIPYIIKKSNNGQNDAVSFFNQETCKYIRHRNGIIEEDEFKNEEIFFFDSSFIPELLNDKYIFHCSNVAFQSLYISYHDNTFCLKNRNDASSFDITVQCKIDDILSCNGYEYIVSLPNNKRINCVSLKVYNTNLFLRHEQGKLIFSEANNEDPYYLDDSSFHIKYSSNGIILYCSNSELKNFYIALNDSNDIEISNNGNPCVFTQKNCNLFACFNKILIDNNKINSKINSLFDSFNNINKIIIESKNINNSLSHIIKSLASHDARMQRIDSSLNEIQNIEILNYCSQENPLISIIMPVYNTAQYLEECLDCIVCQNMINWELICVDDGSNDGSDKILERYSKYDKRINVIRQENQGAGVARNYGLSIAKGKYLLILDSDDIYAPDFLYQLVKKAILTDADITICRSNKLVNGIKSEIPWTIKTEYLPQKTIFGIDDIAEYVFQLFVGWSWDKLYKKDFVEDFSLRFQDLRSTNDAYFVFMSLCLANKISTLNAKLVTHRYHDGSLAHTRHKDPTCFIQAIKKIEESLKKYNLLDKVKESFYNWILNFSHWHYKTIDKENKNIIYDSVIKLLSEKDIPNDLNRIYDTNDIQWLLDNGLMKNPCVSIIVPTYNVEQYIDQCLSSLVNQTLKNIEIIIVNDGSTDLSLSIARKYEENDKRIKIIDKENTGYGDSMNIGINEAKGEYIGIVEPDDFVSENMYDYLYKIARKENLDLIKSDFNRFVHDENGDLIKTYNKLDKTNKFYNKVIDTSKTIETFRFIMNTWSGIYKREFLNKFNIRHNTTPGASFQDNGFWFQTFCLAKRAYFVDKAFYMNRRDNINSSVKSKDKIYAFAKEYEFIKEFIKKINGESVYMPIYWLKKFHNYMFNLSRIDENAKYEFLMFFSKEFCEACSNNELKCDLFTDKEKITVQEIMCNPDDYYEKFIDNE